MRPVLVLPLKSFDQFEAGVAVWVQMDTRIAELIVVHYFRLLWDTAWEEEWTAADGSEDPD